MEQANRGSVDLFRINRPFCRREIFDEDFVDRETRDVKWNKISRAEAAIVNIKVAARKKRKWKCSRSEIKRHLPPLIKAIQLIIIAVQKSELPGQMSILKHVSCFPTAGEMGHGCFCV